MIINITRESVISKDSFFKKGTNKIIGLMFNKEILTIVFKTRFGIHTFFLKEPIDVLILSKNLNVVKQIKSLKPFRVFFWNPKYDLVIELPKNSILKSGTKIGDQIKISL